MKATLLLTLLTTLQVSASLYSQETKLTLDIKDKPLTEVIKSIEKQSTYRFFYSDNYRELTNLVTINVTEKNINDVLTDLLEEKALDFRILDNNIVVIAPTKAFQQQKVTGTVTDAATGEPLPGVSVQVEGTTTGAVTDMKGKYSLDAPKDATLSFSFMGFVTERVTVSGPTLDVKLVSDVKKLDEVVVIGYGVQRREAVTSSVASVKGDIVREVASADISNSLQGRVAGVDMQQTSTKPGQSMQIRIRGTRSLNASNDPLVVLDGIPFAGNINDLNPSDIKSVDILKDASATAIYGSRGANGVIMITTTKGSSKKVQVTYTGYYGVKDIFAKYPMMGAKDFLKLRKVSGKYPQPGADEDTTGATNTDWQKLFWRLGSVTNHDLGIQGGTEKGSYMFGAGYYKEVAVAPGQDFTRYSIRATIDQEVGKYLRFGFSSNNNYSISEGNNLNIYGVLSLSPIIKPYNADGTWKRAIQMPADNQWVYTKDAINGLGDSWIDETKGFGSYNSLYGEFKVPGVEGLKYRANFGVNYRHNVLGQYQGQGVFNYNAATVSTATYGTSVTASWALENMLTYDRLFAKKHQVSIVALYSTEQNSYNSQRITAQDVPADNLQFYSIGRANQTPIIDPENQNIDPNHIGYVDPTHMGSGYELSGLLSYMGRVSYSYDSRYMLMASIRTDASSRLAPGHKYVSYPAVSVGWNITNESFMKSISTIVDQLKVRVGYGVTSNQAINPYQTLGLLKSNAMNLGSTLVNGYDVTQLPNPSLGWETTSEMNYALDFSILKNRLSGSLDFYQENTKNLLQSFNLPPTTGVQNITQNVASSSNRGTEFSLTGVILNNLNGWTWEASVNIYCNRNKLESLASGATQDINNNWFVGHPIDVIYDYKAIGLWQAGDQFMKNYEGPNAMAGMIKVKYTGTYNADGSPTRLIGQPDEQIMSMEPNFQGGFNTRVAYKGFDLSVVGAYKNGGLLIATPYGSSGYLNILTGRRGQVNADYWTPTNTGAKFPVPGGPGGDSPTHLNSLSYMDASYMKIRTITLGYNFEGNKWFKRTGIQKLRLYFTAQNPFVLFSPFYRFSGMDPETNSYGNENAAVPLSNNLRRLLTIGTNTPTTRNYLIGLNVTF